MIKLEHVDKYFGDLHVLKDVNLEVAEGEKLVIIGPSGSGKSTTVRCMNFLEEPTSGHVYIDGQELTNKNKTRIVRDNMSMVFQQFNVGVKLGRLQKFGGNFQSGCVFGVEDTPFGVAALPGQFIILSLVAGVKVHSPFQQFPDSVRAFLHDSAHGLFVAEARSGVQRIRNMVFKGIVAVPYGGDASLCLGGTAIQKFAFCNDCNLAVFRRSQGETQSGNTCPND